MKFEEPTIEKKNQPSKLELNCSSILNTQCSLFPTPSVSKKGEKHEVRLHTRSKI